MRTWNLVLLAYVLIFGMGRSTVEAQRNARPFLNVDPPVYQNNLLPQVSLSPGVAMPPSGSISQWYPFVIARPGDRVWIRQTPMELRPNRPMHFWGNSRRRVLR